MACLLSPYEKTIWIDSDCEIRGSLQPLFNLSDHPSGMAIATEFIHPANQTIGLNAGVIVFKRDIPLIEQWADQSIESNHLFAGDEDVLAAIINEKKIEVNTLPLLYNWSRCREINPDAIVVHWHGKYGKATIAHQIMRSNLELFST